jgi:hypothetical protein
MEEQGYPDRLADTVQSQAKQHPEIRFDFRPGPTTTGKSGSWVDLEAGDVLGQLIVWDTGEADLLHGRRGEDETQVEHRQFKTIEEVDAALGDLIAVLVSEQLSD